MAATCLITGAAGAIGSAVARRLAGQAGALALLDRDEAALGALAAELEASGTAVATLPCDVGDEAGLGQAVDAAIERFGAPRGLVTAAGIDRGGQLHALEASDFDAVVATNLRGTFLACRACLRPMIAAGGGSIACISSPLATVATPGGSAAYSASKAGVSALVRSLAVDYAAQEVRVNAVLPGPTESELMWANVPAGEVGRVRETVRGEVPLGRLARPDEIAATVAWLLSDQSSFVTGAQIPCDGGVLAKASVSI